MKGAPASLDPSKSLLQWTFNKQLSSSNASDEIGTMDVTLTAGVPGKPQTTTWADLIQPMDLIVVYVGNSQKTMRTRFIGYIQSVTMQVDTTSPQNPQRSVQIQASDLLMGLNTQILFLAYQLAFLDTPNDSKAAQTAENLLTAFGEEVSAVGQSITGGSIGWLSYFTSFAPNQISQKNALLLDPSSSARLLINDIATVLFNPVVKIGTSKFAGQASYRQLLSLCFADTSLFTGAQVFSQPQNGAIYDMITQMSNAPFLEFFGDVRSADEQTDIPVPSGTTGVMFGPDNAQFCIVLRNTPYNTTSGLQGTASNAFEQLEAVDAFLKDTSQQSYGVDTSDVINYYQTVPQGYLQSGSTFVSAVNASIPGKVDVGSALKYGLQPLTVNVLGFPKEGGAFAPLTINQFNDTLYDWYKDNPAYVKGSIQVHGNPLLKVGKRVRLRNLDGHKWLDCYGEGVSETYVNMTSYTCNLTFSRGVYVG